MKPTKEEIAQILEKHAKWLDGAEGGERANLRGANLCGANLREANLRGANLCGANLCEAILYGANLCGANLREANLREAILYGANLREAILYGANLCGANLYGANLRGANLREANLCEANLCEANLPPFQIPQGDLTVYKKLRNNIIATLVIPRAAKRTASLVGRKCRAEYADVIKLETASGEEVRHGESSQGGLVYELNARVLPDAYDDDFRVECTSGIHFFLTREEAEKYN